MLKKDKPKHAMPKASDVSKSRNEKLKESKTHQPKAFGRKNSSKAAEKSITDQLIDGLRKYESYV